MPETGARSWRPLGAIRVVAIGLAISAGRLLVVEVLDDAGNLKGWRPPGGGVHFTEPAAEAVRREIREELGCEVRLEGAPTVFENLYEHHGSPGHEIVFAFPIALIDANIPSNGQFAIEEDDGSSHWAEWVDARRLADGTDTLLPTGLASWLQRHDG